MMKYFKAVNGGTDIKAQQGSVLVISLILLLVMTLLGLSSMQTSVMEEMMAGNTKDQNLAFQSAEAALRDAEVRILGYSSEPTPAADGSSGVWIKNSPDVATINAVSWWCESNINETWWTGNGIAFSGVLSGTSVPYSLVEEDDFVKDSLNVGQQQDESGKVYYRLSSRGTGGSNQALSLLRSTYSRRY
ncbi:MAG: PilX N-terminal domain-containing pilus assembly protein [Pseudomonadota bacterium]